MTQQQPKAAPTTRHASLRDRASAARQSAETVVDPTSSEAPDPAVPVDPIHHWIDEHRALNVRIEKLDPVADALVWDFLVRERDILDGAIETVRPTTAAGLLALATYLRSLVSKAGSDLHQKSEIGFVIRALLNAIGGIALREWAPPPEVGDFHPRAYAKRFDFAPFDITGLTRIYEAAREISNHWSHMANMPRCFDGYRIGLPRATAIGLFIDYEEERLSFFRDRCIAELERRKPSDSTEISLVLDARIKHELDCGGTILDRDLLLAAVKAWG